MQEPVVVSEVEHCKMTRKSIVGYLLTTVIVARSALHRPHSDKVLSLCASLSSRLLLPQLEFLQFFKQTSDSGGECVAFR